MIDWLMLSRRASLSAAQDLPRWIDEGRQLVRILNASARTAKGRVPSLGVVASAQRDS